MKKFSLGWPCSIGILLLSLLLSGCSVVGDVLSFGLLKAFLHLAVLALIICMVVKVFQGR